MGKSTKKCWNEQINQQKIDLSLPLSSISNRLCTFAFKSGEILGDFDSDLKKKTKKLMFCLVFRLAQLYR